MFDYVFALRPSTVCNFKCSYCIGHDDLIKNYANHNFNIDSMIWHVSQYPNSIVNICGYGETMMHPQFDDLVIELSKITKVNWVTNGTMFNSTKFKNIIKYANHANIHDVIISVHFSEIQNFDIYVPTYYDAEQQLKSAGIDVHTTTIATEDNVDMIIAYREFFPNIHASLPFYTRIYNNEVIKTPANDNILIKLLHNNVKITFNTIHMPPYIGINCMSGYKVFDVMHDGNIYDCYFDENKKLIGNINIKNPIDIIQSPRICNSSTMSCSEMAINGCGLIKKS